MMSESLVPFEPTMLALLKGSLGKDGLALPFVQENFLMQCHIAGTSYCDLDEIETGLIVSDLLVIKREPENPHDELAILIFDE